MTTTGPSTLRASPQLTSIDVNERLQDVIALHFDPRAGTPYWLDVARRLGFDPRREIRSIADLPRLGTTEPAMYGSRPLTEYIPRAILAEHSDLVIAQTGGTSGTPVWTAYLPNEYEAAFVRPFVAAAEYVGFPQGGVWLYVGPSGPHIIGRAAESLAVAMGAARPFTVDFDSRWAKKLPVGSFAAARYLGHVVDQALAVVESQPITHLFSTPPVLAALTARMSAGQRGRIAGVHYGGMELDPSLLCQLQSGGFPNAVHLAGYGNTLFGCCLELDVSMGREPSYFPHGDRLLFGFKHDVERLPVISYGSEGSLEGRVVFSRLDRAQFIANCVERDHGARCRPPAGAPSSFRLNGIRSPRSADTAAEPLRGGIY